MPTATFASLNPSLQEWVTAFSSGLGNQGFGNQGFGNQGFGNQGFGQQPGGQPMGGPGYGGAFGPQTPPPRRSNWWIWLVGGLGLGGLLVCGCCGGVMMFGLSTMSSSMEDEVAGDPAIQQHIGEIRSMNLNLAATGEEAQKRANGKNIMVYDVKGTAGDGQLIGEQARNPQPGYVFDKIDLRLKSGEVISIK